MHITKVQEDLSCQPITMEDIGTCRECGGILPLGSTRRVKEIFTPKGRFRCAEAAAAAYGISLTTAWDRAKSNHAGWRYTGNTFPPDKLSPNKRRKFCSTRCSNAWHGRNRDGEPRNERIAFALKVLKFMEKHYPEQTAKMRTGFANRRKDR